jgi:O-antigen/teichoic acid export membrane protein
MNKLGRGAAWITLSGIVFMLSGYAINIFLGRRLGPELYGIYGVLVSIMNSMNVMQITGIPQSVSKFTSENENEADSILASGLHIQLYLTFLIGVVFFSSAHIIASVFNDERFVGYTRAFALIFPLYGIFALYTGFYNGLHRFKKQALMNSIYSVSKLVLVIGLAFYFGLYGVIVGFIISPLIALLFGFKLPKTTNLFSRRVLIIYSLPLIGFAVLATLQLSIDLFSLKAIVADSKIAGYYTAAQSIALIIYYGMSAIGQVLFPSISKFTGSGNIKEASRIISKSLRYLLIILLPVASIMIATASDLVEVLFGKKYLPAVAPLQILLLSYVLLTIFSTLANVLNSSRHARSSVLAAGTGLVVTLILCLFLIPNMGMKGAAIASLIGALISASIATIKIYKTFHFQFSFISVLRISIGSAVILAMGSLIQPPLLMLPLFYVFLWSLYVAVIYMFSELTLEDRSHIKNLFPSWFLTRWL